MKRYKYGYTDDGFGGARFLTLIEDDQGPVVLWTDAKSKITELEADLGASCASAVADQVMANGCPGHARSECVSCCWPKDAAPEPVQTCQIGIYGKAYDGPGVTRAYTYQHQPHNVGASKLGQACYHAIQKPGGDSIDLGLGLLKHLQDAGFGVFEVKS